jgi:hypothetical protein
LGRHILESSTMPIYPLSLRSGSFLRSLTTAVVTMALLAPMSGQAQLSGCLQQVQTSTSTSAWLEIRQYFASLASGPEQRNKAQLIQLRSRIVSLESEKQRLLDVIFAHQRDSNSGSPIGLELSVNRIPGILQEIGVVSGQLKSMAQSANLFAAEPAFKQLVINLDAKRAVTLCQLSQEASRGFTDKAAVKRLSDELAAELGAIASAEDALAKYIRDLK